MRMSSNRFRVDYEVGRVTIRRLGSFRPVIGRVFGLALYFLFRSKIPQTIRRAGRRTTAFFFFGILAFLAGFNERWMPLIRTQLLTSELDSYSSTPRPLAGFEKVPLVNALFMDASSSG